MYIVCAVMISDTDDPYRFYIPNRHKLFEVNRIMGETVEGAAQGFLLRQGLDAAELHATTTPNGLPLVVAVLAVKGSLNNNFYSKEIVQSESSFAELIKSCVGAAHAHLVRV